MRNQIFICYSHKDKKWLERIRTHLRPYKSVVAWDDTHIKPGQVWREQIKRALGTTKVVLLLVSPDFLASDFITQQEFPQLLKAASTEGVIILWVAVRYSSYTETEIEQYQAANDPQNPLAALKPIDQDRVLVDICKQMKTSLELPAEKSILSEKTLNVILSMAFGTIVESFTFQCRCCPYCSYRDTDAKKQHDYECPVVAARELLQDAGMPLSIFQVDHESLCSVRGWQKSTDYVRACSPEAIQQRYDHEYYRNVHVQFTREVKPYEI